jgi:biopolymer transport protein ExbB
MTQMQQGVATMSKAWKRIAVTAVAAAWFLGVGIVTAQENMSTEEAAARKEQAERQAGTTDFWGVVTGSGTLGVLLWTGLFATSLAGIYLIIDSFVKIRPSKIMPASLLEKVRAAMNEGDLGKALEYCKEEPTVLSNILRAGFENVEEGFDVIQESINAVADLESEKLLQKVSYLSVVSNLAPMLGLLGTVQGMIYAFATLGTQQAGAAQQALLAQNISQALYTTAAGLSVAVPAVAFFYFFRNRANNIILSMVILTNDLIKTLRNVEVVQE